MKVQYAVVKCSWQMPSRHDNPTKHPLFINLHDSVPESFEKYTTESFCHADKELKNICSLYGEDNYKLIAFVELDDETRTSLP